MLLPLLIGTWRIARREVAMIRPPVSALGSNPMRTIVVDDHADPGSVARMRIASDETARPAIDSLR